MKVSYCGVGNVGFSDETETFIADVIVQFGGDERLAHRHLASSHDLKLTIRIKGARAWPFERVQQEILNEAGHVLGLAREHLAGATVEALARYNAERDHETEQARKAQLRGILQQTT